MDFSSLLPGHLALAFGVISCLALATLLALNKKQREIVFSRLHVRNRRTSGAKTPPRSLSPEKEPASETPEYAATPPGLVDAFPPSRREVLPQLFKTINGMGKEVTIASEPTNETLKKTPLPIDENYMSETIGVKYTPTGFSTAEIKALGDFPDYATLSGVPLPQEYKGYQFEKALPRPYRPLRWAYHQTMCKLVRMSWENLLI